MNVKKFFSVLAAFVFVFFSQSVLSGFNPIEEVTGTASYYAKKFEGTRTATGEVFSNKQFTAASNLFRLHSWVKVTNLNNSKSVIVRINDRMHPKMLKRGRVIDLSRNAAKELSMIGHGITKVKLQVVEKPDNE